MIVENFHDDRIRLCTNKENLGLDENILCGIENCRGKFVFLLVSTDLVISQSIPYMIEVIKDHPDVVYISGTSLDNDGLPRNILKEHSYKMGIEALSVHWKLHAHPAGSLFRKSAINIARYKKYLNMFQEKKFYFMVEQLMRLDLSQKGDFYFISRPIWIYTYRHRNRKLSVHNNAHIYDIDIIYQRYKSEQMFIANELNCDWKVECQIYSFEFWLRAVTWDYLNIMKDEGLRNHYGIEQRTVDIDMERKNFLRYVSHIELEYDIIDAKYLSKKNAAIKDNILFKELYEKQIKSHEKAIKSSQPTLQIIEEIKNAGFGINDIFEKSGCKKIGLYGMGYLGIIIWNEIVGGGIKPEYICDKKYDEKVTLENGVPALPPGWMHLYDVDVLIVTPMHLAEDIFSELTNIDRQKVKTIYEFLHTYKKVLA